ncbi:MAG: helix-turn-helix domain-containing protein [Bacillota bacterium]
MVALDGLSRALGGLGFSKYEVAAYLALVRVNPVSGYELAKVSGVPQAKVYEVLGRLKVRGAAVQVSAEPALYAPLNPMELVRRLRSQYGGLCDELESGLQQLKDEGGVEYIWNLLDYDAILAKARNLCDESSQELQVLCWEVEYGKLEDCLGAACKRGVKLFVVGHGLETMNGCAVVAHGVLPHVMEERGRQLAVVSDNRATLLSSVDPTATGVWTRNSGLIALGRELIMHEAYLWRVLHRFRDIVVQEYGENLERLRTWDRSS